jgi:AraC-like DNA-binding protein
MLEMSMNLIAQSEQDLVFHYSGIEPCAPGNNWKSIRDHFLFHYIITGKGRVRYGATENSLEAGTGFLFFPGNPCDYRADIQDPWKYLWCAFSGKMAEYFLSTVGLTRNSPIFYADESQQTAAELEDITATLAKSHDFFQQMQYLYRFFYALERHCGGEKPGGKIGSELTDYVDAVFSYIRTHYNQKDSSVESMARRLGLNRTYLATLLKKKTGKSPQELMLQYRMNRSCELLSTKDIPISEVAEAVGYADPLTFSRAFHRWADLSPREYRKQTYVRKALLPDANCEVALSRP